MDALYKHHFPHLIDVASKKTSEKTERYNCIAWAFKDNRRHWWPNGKRSYWPISALGLSVSDAFEKWFEVDGWERCSDDNQEAGFEKVALYCLQGQPTHAARQLDTGLWTSKLGPDIDLTHKLHELSGPSYGVPTRYYRKALPAAPATQPPSNRAQAKAGVVQYRYTLRKQADGRTCVWDNDLDAPAVENLEYQKAWDEAERRNELHYATTRA